MKNIKIKVRNKNRLDYIRTDKVGRYYYSNGMIKLKEIYSDEHKHIISNENEPARIEYYRNGKTNRIYYSNNKFGGKHRIDGPAIIEYDRKNIIIDEEWYYKSRDYTNKVIKWLKFNNMNWEEMNESDFNRMWFEIL